jgi:hypothetical protein
MGKFWSVSLVLSSWHSTWKGLQFLSAHKNMWGTLFDLKVLKTARTWECANFTEWMSTVLTIVT